MVDRFAMWTQVLDKWEKTIAKAERQPGRVPKAIPREIVEDLSTVYLRQMDINPEVGVVYDRYRDLQKRFDTLKDASEPTAPPANARIAPTPPSNASKPVTFLEENRQCPKPSKTTPRSVASRLNTPDRPCFGFATPTPRGPPSPKSRTLLGSAIGGKLGDAPLGKTKSFLDDFRRVLPKHESQRPLRQDSKATPSDNVSNTVEETHPRDVRVTDPSLDVPRTAEGILLVSSNAVVNTMKGRKQKLTKKQVATEEPSSDTDSDRSCDPVGSTNRLANMRSILKKPRAAPQPAIRPKKVLEFAPPSWTSTAASGLSPSHPQNAKKVVTFAEPPKPPKSTVVPPPANPPPPQASRCHHTTDLACDCEMPWSRWGLGYESRMEGITRDKTIFKSYYTIDKFREMFFCAKVRIPGGCKDPTCVLRDWPPEPNERIWMNAAFLKVADKYPGWKYAPTHPLYKGPPHLMRNGLWCYGADDMRQEAPDGVHTTRRNNPLIALFPPPRSPEQLELDGQKAAAKKAESELAAQTRQDKKRAVQEQIARQQEKKEKKEKKEQEKEEVRRMEQDLRQGRLTNVVSTDDSGQFLLKKTDGT